MRLAEPGTPEETAALITALDAMDRIDELERLLEKARKIVLDAAEIFKLGQNIHADMISADLIRRMGR